MTQTYSVEEFVGALSPEGVLPEPIVLVGAFQKGTDPNAVMFSEGTACAVWTSIPRGMIEKVEPMGSVTCSENKKYPFVRLFLKEPEQAEAAVFSELLKRSPRGAELPCGGAMAANAAPPAMPDFMAMQRMPTAAPAFPPSPAGLGQDVCLIACNAAQAACEAVCPSGALNEVCKAACRAGGEFCRSRCASGFTMLAAQGGPQMAAVGMQPAWFPISGGCHIACDVAEAVAVAACSALTGPAAFICVAASHAAAEECRRRCG